MIVREEMEKPELGQAVGERGREGERFRRWSCWDWGQENTRSQLLVWVSVRMEMASTDHGELGRRCKQCGLRCRSGEEV